MKQFYNFTRNISKITFLLATFLLSTHLATASDSESEEDTLSYFEQAATRIRKLRADISCTYTETLGISEETRQQKALTFKIDGKGEWDLTTAPRDPILMMLWDNITPLRDNLGKQHLSSGLSTIGILYNETPGLETIITQPHFTSGRDHMLEEIVTQQASKGVREKKDTRISRLSESDLRAIVQMQAASLDRNLNTAVEILEAAEALRKASETKKDEISSAFSDL